MPDALPHTNLLIHEKSPYLLQHANNPVDWHAWNDEALARAKREDKPIFLSIGYSTCHWCHVMAHESFEDEEVARLLNDAFVCIKVDREERPDLDGVYMSACQMLTGQGGWPLTVMLTPDKQPFFAATYLPKQTRSGRTGMLELIPRVQDMWKNNRPVVDESAENISDSMRDHAKAMLQPSDRALDLAIVDKAVASLAQRYDAKYGGFGSSPKFPSPHNLLLLLRHAQRTGESKTLRMVEHTLTAMRLGGMYDHVGFGFHRYSTDEEWRLPHFEKMLYDQAMLAWAYIEGWEATDNPLLRRTAEEVFGYVLRDMTLPEGAFCAAEDADSQTASGEREEGWFYTFTLGEFNQLPQELGELAVKVYGITPDGNFADEATGRRTGRNVLYMSQTVEQWAKQLNMSERELSLQLTEVRETLFRLRDKRVRPHLDDKVLVDWNGLMIGALARGARAFGAPQYAQAAEKAARFILSTMRDDSGRLLHRYRAGEAGIPAMLDDYAMLIHGLIELYQVTFAPHWLITAVQLQQEQDALFGDAGHGGYYLVSEDGDELPVRQKEAYDAAMPSGNSMAAYNLARLSRMLGKPDMAEKANRIFAAFATQGRHVPSGYSMMLSAVEELSGGRNIIVVGEQEAHDVEALLEVVNKAGSCNVTVAFCSEQLRGELAGVAPFVAGLQQKNGLGSAYLCENYTCSPPIVDVGVLASSLGVAL